MNIITWIINYPQLSRELAARTAMNQRMEEMFKMLDETSHGLKRDIEKLELENYKLKRDLYSKSA